MPWTQNKGLYILILTLREKAFIPVGKLGIIPFPSGTYCYIGRAKRHLRQRLARHSMKSKPTRWHIDYLLPHVEIQAVILLPLSSATECTLAKQLVKMGGKPHPLHFGASDCRCTGHLIYFAQEATPHLDLLAITMGNTVGFLRNHTEGHKKTLVEEG